MKTHGWDSVKLSDAYTLAELETLRQQVIKEHSTQHIGGRWFENGFPTIYEVDPKGRKKLESLAHAVTFKLTEIRKKKP